jgi:hypothetical protein
VVRRIGELIDYPFVRIIENLKEQNFNYFNTFENRNSMIREIVIEKAEKGSSE